MSATPTMRVQFAAAVGACLLIGGAAPAARAEELRNWTPYNDFYELQQRFDSIPAPQRERLGFRFRLVSQDPGLAPDQARLYIVRQQQRIEIPVDADGAMRLPRNEQYHKENLTVYTSLNKNQRLGIKAEVLITLPEQPAYQYADLIRWMTRAGDATRSRAGVWSVFMPKPSGLDVKLGPGGYALLQRANGSAERVMAREDGYVHLAVDKQREAANPTVSFSSKPLEALPHYDKNMTLFGDGDR